MLVKILTAEKEISSVERVEQEDEFESRGYSAPELHDVGNAVSYQRHHRHSYYLIVNAEIPGLRERERELVARIARYHRRSPPDPSHSGMEGLGPGEVRVVRKLSTLLRVADSLDRSHRQSIVRLQARLLPNAVLLKLRARSPLDLELWDATHEAGLFRRVFGRHKRILVDNRERANLRFPFEIFVSGEARGPDLLALG